MSILNRPGDGHRSTLLVIFRLLLQEGSLERENF